MTDELKKSLMKSKPSFSQEVGVKAARKIKARRNSNHGIWFGFGMMGLIGWSVVVPTLLGATFGIWLDKHYVGTYSWTLMLLVVGLFVGCLNALHWMAREDRAMRDDQEDNDE